MSLHVCVYVFKQSFLGLFVVDVVDVCARESVCEREMYTYVSSIDMYNNDVGKRFMK